tara:strand:- start:8300 stop:8992 length:693 start_codon:yes stop_codon:yes gene_type:complete
MIFEFLDDKLYSQWFESNGLSSAIEIVLGESAGNRDSYRISRGTNEIYEYIQESATPQISSLLKIIGNGNFHGVTSYSKTSYYFKFKGMETLDFWKNKRTPIPWDTFEDGAVVVFYIANAGRDSQLWIVRLNGRKIDPITKINLFNFSYALISPHRKRGSSSDSLYALRCKIRINGPEHWQSDNDATSKSVYFLGRTSKWRQNGEMYWTKLQNTYGFINWMDNPLEVFKL